MTSDPGTEDIERLATTQISPEQVPAIAIVRRIALKQSELVDYGLQPEALGAAGASCGVRAAASSAAVELGRRLLVAARAGDTDAVLQLMAKGAYFTPDWLGTSPLHLAAVNGHVKTCTVLLRAGVSRDTRTKVDRTPLHLAAYSGHALVAKVLLDNGANVDCRDMLGMTPLHWAVERGHAAVASLLVARGADVHARSKFLKTPIGLAAAAAARGRPQLQSALDDALKEREATDSVQALVTGHLSDGAAESQVFESIEEVSVTPTKLPTNTKQTPEKIIKLKSTSDACAGAGGGAEGAGARLLRRHGITLLPADDGGTVLSALQSGRTVVLSDAGKLMLKESGEPAQSASTKASAHPQGVVLTATPVRSPPRAGVKVFTLSNRLLAVTNRGRAGCAADGGGTAQDAQVGSVVPAQVKYVQLPVDAKIISPPKLTQNKTKAKIGVRSDSVSSRPVVKILMDKSNFNKLIATQFTGDKQELHVTNNNSGIDASEGADGGAAAAPESCAPNMSAVHLRAQLAAARASIADLTATLAATRARLAQYEGAQ